jgi:hypothetical protein
MARTRITLAKASPRLARQWHLGRNGSLTPKDVGPSSHKKVWWQCKTNDDHVWLSTVKNRSQGNGCPFCAGKLVSATNSLLARRPDLVAFWDEEANAPLRPSEITEGSGRLVWWKCPTNPQHVWKRVVAKQCSSRGCPFCRGRRVSPESSLASVTPHLAKQWHPTLNKSLTPYGVTGGSSHRVWWQCPRVPAHIWVASISNRKKGQGCPFCAGKRASPENNLASVFPDVALEWHPTRNTSTTPKDVTPGSGKLIWWRCRRDPTHEWRTTVSSRSRGSGCPRCVRQTSMPELRILSELQFLFKAVRSRYRIDGCECDVFIENHRIAVEYDGYRWHKTSAVKDKRKCRLLKAQGIRLIRVRERPLPLLGDTPELSAGAALTKADLNALVRLLQSFVPRSLRSAIRKYLARADFANDKAYRIHLSHLPGPAPDNSLANNNPSLASEWHKTRNHPLIPASYSHKSGKIVWWQCSKDSAHEWRAAISARANGAGCPFCVGQRVCRTNSIQHLMPSLAREWHPTRNGQLRPEHVTVSSGRMIWWKCSRGQDHEWRQKVAHRTNGVGCPFCAGKRVCSDNSLAALDASLASEWHPSKNGSLTPSSVRPYSNKRVWWRCKKNPAHEWVAVIGSRSAGRGCPFCSGNRLSHERSLASLHPSIAIEWHPIKNHGATAQSVTAGSGMCVWWRCSRNPEHEWQDRVVDRVKRHGCPFCSRKRVTATNNLSASFPDLAKQWHPTKNGALVPSDLLPHSGKKVWWRCSSKATHVWRATVRHRSNGTGCPFCAGRVGRLKPVKQSVCRRKRSRT